MKKIYFTGIILFVILFGIIITLSWKLKSEIIDKETLIKAAIEKSIAGQEAQIKAAVEKSIAEKEAAKKRADAKPLPLNEDANSFTYTVSKFEFPAFSQPPAGIVYTEKKDGNDEVLVVTRGGKVISDFLPTPIIKLPEGGGEILNFFRFKNVLMALIGRTNKRCRWEEIIDLSNGKSLYNAPCLPNRDEVAFIGGGGGFAPIGEDSFLLAIGPPEFQSGSIRKLAQKLESPYGKIHKFTFSKDKTKLISHQYTVGHRNPQGIRKIKGNYYSVEHGPQGGDELNRIQEGKNYGWPLYSFGRDYKGGRKVSNFKSGDPKNKYTGPLYAFIPSIAPHGLVECPKVLAQSFAPYSCILISALKNKSISVVVLDTNTDKVISIETIKIPYRLRDFAVLDNGKLPNKHRDSIIVSTDETLMLEVKFSLKKRKFGK